MTAYGTLSVYGRWADVEDAKSKLRAQGYAMDIYRIENEDRFRIDIMVVGKPEEGKLKPA